MSTSVVGSPSIHALVVGAGAQTVTVSVTVVAMMRPTATSSPFIGYSYTKSGHSTSNFDLGDIIQENPSLVCSTLEKFEDPLRDRVLLKAISNIPGVTSDDFWTGLANLGMIALKNLPDIIQGFTK